MAEDLSKRGKVGDVYRSGSFAKAKKKGLKTSALNKAQLKRAQTVGGKKITARQVKRATSAKNKTSISDTKFVKGQGVLGPNGKPLTGTVTLASGKTAQYVKGRRVVASKKAPVAKPRSGGGTGGSSNGNGGNKGKKTLTGPMIQPGIRRNYTHNAAMANKAGAEGPKGNYSFPRNKRGVWLTPKSNARIEQILAKNRANKRKPSDRTVPRRLGK